MLREAQFRQIDKPVGQLALFFGLNKLELFPIIGPNGQPGIYTFEQPVPASKHGESFGSLLQERKVSNLWSAFVHGVEQMRNPHIPYDAQWLKNPAIHAFTAACSLGEFLPDLTILMPYDVGFDSGPSSTGPLTFEHESKKIIVARWSPPNLNDLPRAIKVGGTTYKQPSPYFTLRIVPKGSKRERSFNFALATQ